MILLLINKQFLTNYCSLHQVGAGSDDLYFVNNLPYDTVLEGNIISVKKMWTIIQLPILEILAK